MSNKTFKCISCGMQRTHEQACEHDVSRCTDCTQPIFTDTRIVKPVCKNCGSDDVHQELIGHWNIDKQDYDVEIANWSKAAYCVAECQDSVELVWVEV